MAGPIIWSGSDARMINTDGLKTKAGYSVKGSGEINLIGNSDDATNWAASGAGITVATSRTSTDLPIGSAIPTAIKITPSSGTPYVRYRWTMPTSLKQRKLKLTWEQHPLSGYASADLHVQVYKNSASDYTGSYTEFNLSTDDSSGVSSIPNFDGRYQTTFDADDGDYYELRINRAAGSTALNICQVIVGPGIMPQSATVTQWQSFTGSGGFTNATYTGFYRRVGDSMEVDLKVLFSGAPTGTSTVKIPASLNINTSVLADTSANKRVGIGSLRDTGTDLYDALVFYQGTNTDEVQIYRDDGDGTVSAITATNPITIANGDFITAVFSVPISQWAGSGTVNVGQNEVEFAYNTGTWDAADSTSFGYGPQGQAMGGNLSASRTKRVRFNTPIQATDCIEVEASHDRIVWYAINGSVINSVQVIASAAADGGGIAGVNWNFVSGAPNDLDVVFQQYARAANDDSPLTNWPSTNAYWRVRKASGGSAVGFGNVTQNGAGLVKSAGQLLGTNTNDNPSVGYVGEVLSSVVSSATSIGVSTGQYFDATSLTLTPGDWEIIGTINFIRNGATFSSTDFIVGFNTTSGNSFPSAVIMASYDEWQAMAPVAFTKFGMTFGPIRVKVSATQITLVDAGVTTTASILYLKGNASAFSIATPQYQARMSARRIR